MSSPPGLFYAYAKHSTTDWAWRYLIVFVDRATSDEWWRAVTDSVTAGYNRFDGVKRISPQFYIHNPDINAGNIALTLTDDRVASKFLNRVFFTLVNDRDARILSVNPVLNYVDHISGNGFFIRSALQPDQYWFDDGQKVVVSRDTRTKFTISLVQADNKPSDGKVMIGTDLVSISVTRDGGFVNTLSDGSLSTSRAAELVIPFSRFNGGFAIGSNGALFGTDKGTGDRWELA